MNSFHGSELILLFVRLLFYCYLIMYHSVPFVRYLKSPEPKFTRWMSSIQAVSHLEHDNWNLIDSSITTYCSQFFLYLYNCYHNLTILIIHCLSFFIDEYPLFGEKYSYFQDQVANEWFNYSNNRYISASPAGGLHSKESPSRRVNIPRSYR